MLKYHLADHVFEKVLLAFITRVILPSSQVFNPWPEIVSSGSAGSDRRVRQRRPRPRHHRELIKLATRLLSVDPNSTVSRM